MNNNAYEQISDYDGESFSFDDLQSTLESQIEEHLADLSDIETDFDKIGNPNALSETISTIVWEQFINQIGVENGLNSKNEINQTDYSQKTMDNARNGSGDFVDRYVINKTISKNDGISYVDARIATDRDSTFVNFKEAKKAERLSNNSKILDEYTGNIISGSEKHHVDHVIPVKKIYEDKARKFTGIQTKDLANQSENFAITNENLNTSKNAKTNSEYIKGREIREKTLKENLEKTIDNINSSSAHDLDKRHNIEKEKKKYQNKVDAQDDLMVEKQKNAEDKINDTIKSKIKESTEGTILRVKEQGKVIAMSSLKAVLMGLLAALVKKIIQKLIKWISSGKKNFKSFLDNLKLAISEFVGELKQHLNNAADTLLTSIATAIFGPIVGLIKKTWIFLKQGYKSVKEAINYIKDPENKGKSLSILMLEIGKIITAGLTVGGAIVLGEAIEKSLTTIPFLAVPIPLVGSLASILGIFFGAIGSGIIGAIALNLIDKMIANRKKSLLTEAKIEKGNQILQAQNILKNVVEEKLNQSKNQFTNNVHSRHLELNDRFKSLSDNTQSIDIGKTKNDDDFNELLTLLNS